MFRKLRQARAYIGRELSAYFLLPVAPDTSPSTRRRWYWLRLFNTVGLPIGLVVVAVISLTSRYNIALHKHVTSSSHALGTKAEGAVDGLRHGQLGFHSKEEAGAWLQIDLGKEQDIAGVAAFGRADCCFTQSIPLALELSLDGEKYERVGLRTTAFTQFEPWVTEFKPRAKARYVRLKTRNNGYLVVSEVEVYAR
jgi:F5/8 type C domain